MRSPSTPAARALALVGIGAAAAAGFTALAVAAKRGPTARPDRRIRRGLARVRRRGARRVAAPLFPLGKWWTYAPAAAGIAGYVLHVRGATRRGRAGAAAVASTAALAAAMGPVLDRWVPQPPPPPGRRKWKSVFPSGHALGPGALGAVSAYVLARERLIPPGAAAPIALLPPAILGGGRLAEDKHWPSDVAGGWLAGLALAATCAAAYELAASSRDGTARRR